MATRRPFAYGSKDYIDRLNDIATVGMPRVLTDPNDFNSAPAPVQFGRTMKFNDNGQVFDCTAALTLFVDPDTLVDGWSVFVNAIGGTVTINTVGVGSFQSAGGTIKTISAGNCAVISSDGTAYRIFRMAAT
jgi:hypothetical protein